VRRNLASCPPWLLSARPSSSPAHKQRESFARRRRDKQWQQGGQWQQGICTLCIACSLLSFSCS
jgi:hypothetical protein